MRGQQVAANHKGVGLIHAIIDDYGLETVQEYMYHIRKNAGACAESDALAVSALTTRQRTRCATCSAPSPSAPGQMC
jgi:N-methylhydantoinase B/oxoprolinase/acetone carboxylase alpha subunit